MGFFTRTAMDMLMKTTHPEINRRQCWNLHPHRKPCTECKDICPYGEQIFTRPNLVKDWDPCTECGLCVSACRSGCIIPSPEQVQRDTSAADTDNDTIWIGCEKSTRKNSMVRACISALTWETLTYLALNKKIVLDLTPCGECENDTCADQLRAELTRLVEFFGETMFEARFTLAYEPDEAPYHVKELTRREMFEQVGHGSKSGTKKLLQLLPGAPDEVIDTLEKGISRARAVTPMLEAGMTPEDILGQVCGSLGVAFLETTEVTYKCYCTRERVERALISLGRKELEEIRQEGKTFPVECQFCDAVYSFTPEDIGKLLEKI